MYRLDLCLLYLLVYLKYNGDALPKDETKGRNVAVSNKNV
jgi:hypothetical protein